MKNCSKIIFGFIAIFLFLNTSSFAGDPYKTMAKDLARAIKRLNKPVVAIMSFPYHNGVENSGSSIVSERLTSRITGMKGIRVVERNLIKKILEEQKLTQSGVIDPSSAKQLGKMLGVNVIVTGTLIDMDGKTEVNARALFADTGEVIGGSHAVVDKTWPDKSTFPRERSVRKPKDDEPDMDPKNEAIEIGIPLPNPRLPRGRFR